MALTQCSLKAVCRLVETNGFEPLTPSSSSWRSTTELRLLDLHELSTLCRKYLAHIRSAMKWFTTIATLCSYTAWNSSPRRAPMPTVVGIIEPGYQLLPDVAPLSWSTHYYRVSRKAKNDLNYISRDRLSKYYPYRENSSALPHNYRLSSVCSC